MITAAQQSDWVQQHQALATAPLPTTMPDWLGLSHHHERETLQQLPLLNRRQEAWRYTSIEGLLQQQFCAPSAQHHELAVAMAGYEIAALESYRFYLVNGCLQQPAGDTQPLPAGVTLVSMEQAVVDHADWVKPWFNRSDHQPQHLFNALNGSQLGGGYLLHIDDQVVVDQPIEIIHLTGASGAALLVQPRNLVLLGRGAQAKLIERFVAIEATQPYFNNLLTDISLAEQADLSHERLQQEGSSAYHLASIYLQQGRASRYKGVMMVFGGLWSRTELTVRLNQPEAHCALHGLYTVGDHQLNDIHLNMHHRAPSCSSDEHFKGVLYGEGRGVFDGAILVDRGAQQTEAHLQNHNLLLHPDAIINTKPQLEIYADEVKCSHGTTVGEIEPEQLFYLRSRGIEEQQAWRMLCSGFAEEVIEQIESEALRRYLVEQFNMTLKQAVHILSKGSN